MFIRWGNHALYRYTPHTPAQRVVRAAVRFLSGGRSIPFTCPQHGWQLMHPRPGEQPLTETSLLNVHFVDRLTGFIVGYHGTVLRTTDGENWERLDISVMPDPAPQLWAVTSDEAGNVYVGGGGVPDGSGGVLLRSTDLGASWEDISMEPEFDIVELYFTDAPTLYAIGDSGNVGWVHQDRQAVIRKSTDAGLTWRTVSKEASRTAPGLGVCMRDIQFPSRDTGYRDDHASGVAEHPSAASRYARPSRTRYP